MISIFSLFKALGSLLGKFFSWFFSASPQSQVNRTRHEGEVDDEGDESGVRTPANERTPLLRVRNSESVLREHADMADTWLQRVGLVAL
jgi:hypothetical protein